MLLVEHSPKATSAPTNPSLPACSFQAASKSWTLLIPSPPPVSAAALCECVCNCMCVCMCICVSLCYCACVKVCPHVGMLTCVRECMHCVYVCLSAWMCVLTNIHLPVRCSQQTLLRSLLGKSSSQAPRSNENAMHNVFVCQGGHGSERHTQGVG